MADEETGPGTGAVVIAGAAQLARPVCAPYHVVPPAALHTSQQMPSEDRFAMVMLPPPDASFATTTLTVDALAEGPETNDIEGSDAVRVEMSRDPNPPAAADAVAADVNPVDSACWAWSSFACPTPGALATPGLEPLPECSEFPNSSATRRAVATRLSTVAIIDNPASMPISSCWSLRELDCMLSPSEPSAITKPWPRPAVVLGTEKGCGTAVATPLVHRLVPASNLSLGRGDGTGIAVRAQGEDSRKRGGGKRKEKGDGRVGADSPSQTANGHVPPPPVPGPSCQPVEGPAHS